MKLNIEQKNILRQYLLSNKSIIVDASAGTGKSTLLQAISHKLKHPGSHIFLAFTTAAKAVMESKMPQANVRTTYSVGMGSLQNAFGPLEVNKYKAADNYRLLINKYDYDIKFTQYTGQSYPENDASLLKDILKLVSKSLLNCTVTKHEIENVADFESFQNIPHDSNMMKWACDLAFEIIRVGHKQMVNNGVIDFQEMIAWAAMLPEVTTPVFQELFVDEAQDLSVAQIYLIEKMVPESGQIIAVGDKYQCIYSFAGASGKSLQQLEESFDCIRMPLVTNYRCGKNIIKYAQEIDPNIKAYDGAPEGQILKMSQWDAQVFVEENQIQTWFLCRTNAPLIRLGLGLMGTNTKFTYNRNVLQDRLLGLLWQFNYYSGGTKEAKSNWNNFEHWLGSQKEYSKEKRNIDRFDMLECLEILYHKYTPQSPSKFATAIKRFFKVHSSKAKITLSTIHAAKGFEAHTIIYWGTNLVPHEMAVTDIEKEQEVHLEHIVRTRAIHNLILVTLEKEDSDD
jgi:superfamily I DNA/RNA helicase